MQALDLEQQFHFLDALPDTLYETVITTRHGSLSERVQGILAWRAALLDGRLPKLEALVWPETSITEKLLPRLDVLELPELCKGEESLVDHVLKDICQAVDSIDEWRERELEGLFDDSLQQNRRQRNTPSQLDHQPSDVGHVPEPSSDDGKQDEVGSHQSADGRNSEVGSGQSAVDSQQTPAEAPRPQSLSQASHLSEAVIDTLAKDWGQLQARWRTIQETVTGMATRLGRGWDLSQGVLVSKGWQDFVRLRRWIKGHPELIALIDSLGRDQQGEGQDKPDRVPESVESSENQLHQKPQTIIRTESPMATHGISHSDDIARMLPQEAAYLGHSKLHMLWHARRAEQALLCYQVEGVLSEHRAEMVAIEETRQQQRKKSQAKKGPILLCLDTSASMHGEAEQMAKAICLEVVRLANQEQRRCHLFSFSGPGQVLSQALEFSPQGLRAIIRFLQQSFHGGTDIQGALQVAMEKMQQLDWQQADMLLVSDGRFPSNPQLLDQFNREKRKHGLRVKGIIVGSWSDTHMAALCGQSRPLRFAP